MIMKNSKSFKVFMMNHFLIHSLIEFKPIPEKGENAVVPDDPILKSFKGWEDEKGRGRT